MEITHEKITYVGLGYAPLSDAFQSGREAAQMAKSQIPEGPFNLVLAFGPSHSDFKDFIEGVRLVTGEETLIGLPMKSVVSNEFYSSDACIVVIVQSPTTQFSIAATSIHDNHYLPTITQLFSQFRQSRGNLKQQYEHNGLLMFEINSQKDRSLIDLSSFEMGLESWLVGIVPFHDPNAPLMVADKVFSEGVVGIECLSRQPWGLGSVNVAPFRNQPDIYPEAVKSAFREACATVGEMQAAFGMIMINSHDNPVTKEDWHLIFKNVKPLIGEVPIVGMTTNHHVIQGNNAPMLDHKNSLVAVLVPK